MPRYLLFLTILFITTAFECNAQLVSLSARSLLKLNKASSGRERILKYYRYFRRDSLKNERALLRKFRQRVDSTLRAEKKLAREKIPFLKNASLPLTDSATLLRLNSEFTGDSMRFDSAFMKAEIFDRINANHDFNFQDNIPEKLVDKFDLNSTGTSIFPDNPVDRIRPPDAEVSDRINSLTSELKSESDDLVSAVPDYPEGVDVKWSSMNADEAVQKGKAMAATELEKLMDVRVRSAQQNIAKLLIRYRKFSSSDTSFVGVKRSSLQGKPVKERILIGINFNALTVDPVGFSVAPQLGYKFNRNCSAGAALVYTMMLEDTVKDEASFSIRNSDYRLFASINLLKSFFGYAEGAASRSLKQQEEAGQSWRVTYSAGLGKRFLVHPKLYFNVLAVYRLSGEDTKLLHPDRFQCRIGLALSELALRRRNINYNPNR